MTYVIKVDNADKFDFMMRTFEEKGWSWSLSENPTDVDYYHISGLVESQIICVTYKKLIKAGSEEMAKEMGYTILSYEQFLEYEFLDYNTFKTPPGNVIERDIMTTSHSDGRAYHNRIGTAVSQPRRTTERKSSPIRTVMGMDSSDNNIS